VGARAAQGPAQTDGTAEGDHYRPDAGGGLRRAAPRVPLPGEEFGGGVRKVDPEYPGCKDVHFYLQKDDPTVAVAVGHWETRGHYEKYLAWRTETGAIAKLGELVAAQPSIRYFDKIDA
jgi:quinol monooxygenase YgiN